MKLAAAMADLYLSGSRQRASWTKAVWRVQPAGLVASARDVRLQLLEAYVWLHVPVLGRMQPYEPAP